MLKINQAKENKFLLPLDIQLFSADPQDPPADPPKDPDPQDPPAGTDQEKQFTQADIDRIVQEKMDAAKAAQEAEAERQRLEAEKKYQELYDQEKQKREDLEKQIAQKELDELKTSTILAAGYAPEQLDFVKGIVKGETADELKAALDAIKEHVPPKGTQSGADPSPGNGARQNYTPQSDEEVGRSLYQAIKSKRRRR